MGFTDREMVVLNGGGHSIGQCHHFRSGFSGPWTHNPAQVSNDFFSLLLQEEWVLTTAPPEHVKKQFTDNRTLSLTMLVSDLVFRDDDRFRAIVEEYAQDNDLFLEDFRKAWIKLVNADRFGDVCVTADDTDAGSPEMKIPDQKADMTEPIAVHCHNSDSQYSTMVWVLVGILFLVIVGQFAFMYTNTKKQESNKEIEMMSEQIGGSIVDVKEI